jgi:hypothetical protein
MQNNKIVVDYLVKTGAPSNVIKAFISVTKKKELNLYEKRFNEIMIKANKLQNEIFHDS